MKLSELHKIATNGAENAASLRVLAEYVDHRFAYVAETRATYPAGMISWHLLWSLFEVGDELETTHDVTGEPVRLESAISSRFTSSCCPHSIVGGYTRLVELLAGVDGPVRGSTPSVASVEADGDCSAQILRSQVPPLPMGRFRFPSHPADSQSQGVLGAFELLDAEFRVSIDFSRRAESRFRGRATDEASRRRGQENADG